MLTLKRGVYMKKVSLGTWNTPLENLPNLAVKLGLNPTDLWIKRDDLSSLGGGGNKIRKLEYSCAQALENGATVLVTVGAAQSNHARLTAAAGAKLGLDVELMLAGQAPEHAIGNVVLDGLFGARLHWLGDVNDQQLEQAAQQRIDELAQQGIRAALIPFGGSNAHAALGYVDCAQELKQQATNFDHVFVALGSGGTMAGLVQGLGNTIVHGIHTGAVDDPEQRVRALLSEMNNTAYLEPLQIRMDQVGEGYGFLTAPVKEALTLLAQHEGIVLDPVYTGRAFAGLIAAIRDGAVQKGQRSIFMHTGGFAGFFGHPEVVKFSASLAKS